MNGKYFAIEKAPPKYIEGLVNPTSEEAEEEKEEGKEEENDRPLPRSQIRNSRGARPPVYFQGPEWCLAHRWVLHCVLNEGKYPSAPASC